MPGLSSCIVEEDVTLIQTGSQSLRLMLIHISTDTVRIYIHSTHLLIVRSFFNYFSLKDPTRDTLIRVRALRPLCHSSLHMLHVIKQTFFSCYRRSIGISLFRKMFRCCVIMRYEKMSIAGTYANKYLNSL